MGPMFCTAIFRTAPIVATSKQHIVRKNAPYIANMVETTLFTACFYCYSRRIPTFGLRPPFFSTYFYGLVTIYFLGGRCFDFNLPIPQGYFYLNGFDST